MNPDSERLADYLEHILASIRRIQRYVGAKSQEEFLADDLLQDGVIRNLEVIGEASRNIETRFPEFALTHSELPLAAAYQMRNAISHGYHKSISRSFGGPSSTICLLLQQTCRPLWLIW